MRRVDWRSLLLFALVGTMSAAVPGMFVLDKYVVHARPERAVLHGRAA